MPRELQGLLTNCDFPWHARLTAYLLYVKAHHMDSPVWGPYIASLPAMDEVTCLVAYGPADARELQVKEYMASAVVFSSEAGQLRRLRLAPNGLADTAWAYAMASARSYGGMAAPSVGRPTLYATRPIRPGEELLLSYGEKPNVKMMNNYGFVFLGNPYDRVAVPPAPSSGLESLPPLHGATLLEGLGFEGDWRREDGIDATRATVESVAGDDCAALAVVRRRSVALSLNLTEGQPPAAPEAAPAHHVPLAAVPAERANAAAVRAAFRAALDALPTSLEADAELLAAHERSGSEGGEGRLSALVTSAVRSRMEHKALLAEGVRAMDVYDCWLAGRQGAG
ncbi:hypothetical protein GPECTOR_8g358 [Gonium pectorale]|uniref:SET domain-containing protein n=1 Tax=Gonium pectorale TaxID=33097 RepID=A0A150GT16_GONPE|nr:hypothetical protein GPECTOR_8g358 [Gonium pectorale]|eukprot:KXZ52987.1 hypothetical protein GPECTOR_8g358 [Gonium pectorale]